MNRSLTLDKLKAERKAVTEELQVLDRLIAIHESRLRSSGRTKSERTNSLPPPISIREQIVTVVYNLVHEYSRSVTSEEILDRANKSHILDGVKYRKAFLAAVLDQLTKKKKPQLVRVSRGVYDIIKHEGQPA